VKREGRNLIDAKEYYLMGVFFRIHRFHKILFTKNAPGNVLEFSTLLHRETRLHGIHGHRQLTRYIPLLQGLLLTDDVACRQNPTSSSVQN
jgi:hypothetical protein